MKIKLKLESLQVQSFPTTAEGPWERGTVHARQEPSVPRVQCISDGTCVWPCEDTQEASCAPSCVATDPACCP